MIDSTVVHAPPMRQGRAAEMPKAKRWAGPVATGDGFALATSGDALPSPLPNLGHALLQLVD